MSDSDAEKAWVSQSRNGDPAAFEALIRAHQRMIHALAYRMTGSLADAEDLAQETFIRAYRQLDSYRGTAKFSSWLYRIAVNICLNWRQREARRGQVHECWSGRHRSPAGIRLSGGAGRDQPHRAGGLDEAAGQTARRHCADRL